MGFILLAAFIAVPLVEIALFIVVGGEIGLWPTLGIVVATAVVGTILLRFQGLAVARDAQMRLSRGEPPVSAMLHGVCLIFAAAFLITPGFFTDAVGFLLLLPPVRGVIVQMVGRRLAEKMQRAEDETVIDGTYEDVTPEREPNREPNPSPAPSRRPLPPHRG